MFLNDQSLFQHSEGSRSQFPYFNQLMSWILQHPILLNHQQYKVRISKNDQPQRKRSLFCQYHHYKHRNQQLSQQSRHDQHNLKFYFKKKRLLDDSKSPLTQHQLNLKTGEHHHSKLKTFNNQKLAQRLKVYRNPVLLINKTIDKSRHGPKNNSTQLMKKISKNLSKNRLIKPPYFQQSRNETLQDCSRNIVQEARAPQVETKVSTANKFQIKLRKSKEKINKNYHSKQVIKLGQLQYHQQMMHHESGIHQEERNVQNKEYQSVFNKSKRQPVQNQSKENRGNQINMQKKKRQNYQEKETQQKRYPFKKKRKINKKKDSKIDQEQHDQNFISSILKHQQNIVSAFTLDQKQNQQQQIAVQQQCNIVGNSIQSKSNQQKKKIIKKQTYSNRSKKEQYVKHQVDSVQADTLRQKNLQKQGSLNNKLNIKSTDIAQQPKTLNLQIQHRSEKQKFYQNKKSSDQQRQSIRKEFSRQNLQIKTKNSTQQRSKLNVQRQQQAHQRQSTQQNQHTIKSSSKKSKQNTGKQSVQNSQRDLPIKVYQIEQASPLKNAASSKKQQQIHKIRKMDDVRSQSKKKIKIQQDMLSVNSKRMQKIVSPPDNLTSEQPSISKRPVINKDSTSDSHFPLSKSNIKDFSQKQSDKQIVKSFKMKNQSHRKFIQTNQIQTNTPVKQFQTWGVEAQVNHLKDITAQVQSEQSYFKFKQGLNDSCQQKQFIDLIVTQKNMQNIQQLQQEGVQQDCNVALLEFQDEEVKENAHQLIMPLQEQLQIQVENRVPLLNDVLPPQNSFVNREIQCQQNNFISQYHQPPLKQSFVQNSKSEIAVQTIQLLQEPQSQFNFFTVKDSLQQKKQETPRSSQAQYNTPQNLIIRPIHNQPISASAKPPQVAKSAFIAERAAVLDKICRNVVQPQNISHQDRFKDLSFLFKETTVLPDLVGQATGWFDFRNTVIKQQHQQLRGLSLNLKQAILFLQSISHTFLQRIFQNFGKLNFEGRYGVWLFDQGRFQLVIIDDCIPTKDSQPIYYFSQSNIGILLLQKALAKFYGGYQQLSGVTAWRLVMAISGGLSFNLKQNEQDISELQGLIHNKLQVICVKDNKSYKIKETKSFSGMKHMQRLLLLQDINSQLIWIKLQHFKLQFNKLHIALISPNYHFNWSQIVLQGRQARGMIGLKSIYQGKCILRVFPEYKFRLRIYQQFSQGKYKLLRREASQFFGYSILTLQPLNYIIYIQGLPPGTEYTFSLYSEKKVIITDASNVHDNKEGFQDVRFNYKHVKDVKNDDPQRKSKSKQSLKASDMKISQIKEKRMIQSGKAPSLSSKSFSKSKRFQMDKVFLEDP